MDTKTKKLRPRQKSSAQEKRQVKKVVIVVVTVALLWLFFAPGLGIVSYINKRSEFARVQKESEQLKKANQELQEEIDRLLSDPEYLEMLAREKYEMLKPNEKVYDFSRTHKTEKEED